MFSWKTRVFEPPTPPPPPKTQHSSDTMSEVRIQRFNSDITRGNNEIDGGPFGDKKNFKKVS